MKKIRSPYFVAMIVSALLAAVFALAWGGIVYKSYSMKAEIAAISSADADTAARDSYLVSLKKTFRESSSDLAAIDSEFVSKDGIPALIDDIDARALAAGVQANIGAINLDEASDATVPRQLKIHISGSGPWKNDIGLVSILESLPYATRIDSLDMTSSGPSADKKDGATSWGFNIDLVIYTAN